MATVPVSVFILASLTFMVSCNSLEETTNLDESLDDTLIQMAILHKSIITNQNSTIRQYVKDLRTELVSKIMIQAKKLAQYEKKIETLEKKLSYLEQKQDKTDTNLVNLSNDTKSSLNSLTTTIISVNSTLTTKSKHLKTTVEEVEVDLNSVQSDVTTLKEDGVKKGPDGRIDRALLPGSYADFTLEDVAWGSVHVAAAAACRGSVPTGGTGHFPNQVIPVIVGSTCHATCNAFTPDSKTYFYCASTVTLMGFVKHATNNLASVGEYYNYGCAAPHTASSELSRSDHVSLERTSYMTYCCCRSP